MCRPLEVIPIGIIPNALKKFQIVSNKMIQIRLSLNRIPKGPKEKWSLSRPKKWAKVSHRPNVFVLLTLKRCLIMSIKYDAFQRLYNDRPKIRR